MNVSLRYSLIHPTFAPARTPWHIHVYTAYNCGCTTYEYWGYNMNPLQWHLVGTNVRGLPKSVLIIRGSSYQDTIIHVQYYSKPCKTHVNRAQKIVCVKQTFVLRVPMVYFLTRFYCYFMCTVQIHPHTPASLVPFWWLLRWRVVSVMESASEETRCNCVTTFVTHNTNTQW